MLLKNKLEKRKCISIVLDNLKYSYFEDAESNKKYIDESEKNYVFAYKENNDYVGFAMIKECSKQSLELALMGIVLNMQSKGIGTYLLDEVKKFAVKQGFEFLFVKTVKEGVYEEYDKTNKFYQKMGFKILDYFPDMWDENNPCVIYIMSLANCLQNT